MLSRVIECLAEGAQLYGTSFRNYPDAVPSSDDWRYFKPCLSDNVSGLYGSPNFRALYEFRTLYGIFGGLALRNPYGDQVGPRDRLTTTEISGSAEKCRVPINLYIDPPADDFFTIILDDQTDKRVPPKLFSRFKRNPDR
jgi:hypothetical protein